MWGRDTRTLESSRWGSVMYMVAFLKEPPKQGEQQGWILSLWGQRRPLTALLGIRIMREIRHLTQDKGVFM